MHQNFFDIQGQNVDQGMTGSKIFYSNKITQISNCFMSLTSKRRREVQGFVFSCLIVNEGLELLLTMSSLVLLACKPSDCVSKKA
jgi:hypothetical protein